MGECPVFLRNGFLGTLLAHFHDWNLNRRIGLLEFEGRKAKLESHEDGQWGQFHVMHEDSNDRKLVLKTQASSGPNLMITKVVLINKNLLD